MALSREAWGATLSGALGTALASAYAIATPAGQPYDEPAHWSNVRFYAHEHRMPELGEPGAAYEAQMGPGYYAPAGAIVDLLDATGEGAFVALRFAGVLLVPVLVWLTYLLTRGVHTDPAVAATAAAVVALAPLMPAMAATIQNDYLTIVVAAAATLYAVRLLRRHEVRVVHHLALGALLGLAILTKVVALSLVAALLATYALTGAVAIRTRARWALASLAGVGLVAGWWFVRNLSTYGDLTGATRMRELGLPFTPMQLGTASDAFRWVSSAVSYVYAPVEYHRNVLNAPTAVELAAGVLAIASLAAFARLALARGPVRGRWAALLAQPERMFLVWSVLAAVAFLVASSITVFHIAARLAFIAAPAGAVLLAAATRGPRGTALRVATLVFFTVVNVWVLAGLSRLPPADYWIFG